MAGLIQIKVARDGARNLIPAVREVTGDQQ